MKKLITMTASKMDDHTNLRMKIIAQSPTISNDQILITVESQRIMESEFEGWIDKLVDCGALKTKSISYLNHLKSFDDDGDGFCDIFVADLRATPSDIAIRFSEAEAIQAAYEMAQCWIEERSSETIENRESQLNGDL